MGKATECIVYQAALSQKWDGKMFSHQYRVGIEKTKLAAKKLLEFESTILTVQTFEEIFHYTEKIRKLKIGVGPLWSYDTALRIGFHLKIYPTEVYIQAGVVKGYVKFFGKRPKRRRKIPKSEFPMLSALEAYEIENFLCIWGGKTSNANVC
jgi:hypothetical protein